MQTVWYFHKYFKSALAILQMIWVILILWVSYKNKNISYYFTTAASVKVKLPNYTISKAVKSDCKLYYIKNVNNNLQKPVHNIGS